MESSPEEFDEAAFKQRLDGLFRAWRDEWVPGMMEPVRITEHVRKHSSQKQLEAGRPEEEAYRKFLDYCVEVIVSATKTKKHREVIDVIENILVPPLHADTVRNILSDLFRMTLDKLSASEK